MSWQERMCRFALLGLAGLSLLAGVACRGDSSGSSSAGQKAVKVRPQTYGHGAEAYEAKRTVEIRMSDSLRFEPASITVQSGEVVTFHLVNTGKELHEFTIGGAAAQELHENQMALMDMGAGGHMAGMPGMGNGEMAQMHHHNDKMHKKYQRNLKKRVAQLDDTAAASDSVHVPPGESRDLTWAFTGAQAPIFGCHVSGHWYGGMKGEVQIS
jgi:uncharacterized cupredoxin-like copper-binding protein